MRSQDKTKLKDLANQYDLDIQEFDLEAYSYQEVKMQILKRANARTEEIIEEEEETWESQAEFYDNQPAEERFYIPPDLQVKAEFVNCLVLQFTQRDFGFGLGILKALFKGNLMKRTLRAIEVQQDTHFTERTVWIRGPREVTEQVKVELAKRNVRPRILRDAFLRRDFLHYYKGKIYPISRKDFKEMQQKTSPSEEKVQRRILKALKQL